MHEIKATRVILKIVTEKFSKPQKRFQLETSFKHKT